MPTLASSITNSLTSAGDPVRAVHSQRFFKTGVGEYGEGDIFLGVTVPQVRKIVNANYKQLSIGDIDAMLGSKWHEVRLAAVIAMNKQFPKSEDKLGLYNLYLSQIGKGINNWDLVDVSCPHIVGAYLFDKARTPLYELAKGGLWQKRVSIISTFYFLRYDGTPKLGLRKTSLRPDLASSVIKPVLSGGGVSEDTLTTEKSVLAGRNSSDEARILHKPSKDTYNLAEILVYEKHDLLQKAVGWSLREMGKIDPFALTKFLDKYAATMPRTALRYSIEKFSETERQKYLKMALR